MKKLALVFAAAVVAPSLVLAWLALRSLRDQGFAAERQQALLQQGLAERLAHGVRAAAGERQREFGVLVEKLLGKGEPHGLAARFGDALAGVWPLAEVGFALSLDGVVFDPPLVGRPEGVRFRIENDGFLLNREELDVVWNSPKGVPINLSRLDPPAAAPAPRDPLGVCVFATRDGLGVSPETPAGEPGASRFRQVVGEARSGTLARFLQDELKLLFWYRSERDPDVVFGAQVSLPGLLDEAIRPVFALGPPLADDFAAVLRSDTGRSVAASHAEFDPAGRRPAATAEIGELLPHWQVAVYPRHPERAGEAARAARLTLGLLVALLVLAIGTGSWLIVADLRRQLTLARRKTDFVSNVSHELKTPLTSIRLFSEMLAEGRVEEPDRQRRFLGIIAAEAARLTRLINNVLDFARLERGDRCWRFAPCDLAALARETCETLRPHLEAGGFTLRCDLPPAPAPVNGDRDALAQVLLNLLSNAEKYAGDRREIEVALAAPDTAAATPGANGRTVALTVRDRGTGVPHGCEERIFEQFFRAHDSLAGGVPGTGLGLTLARQIARAHGGDVTHAPREGGGSCFSLTLPAAA